MHQAPKVLAPQVAAALPLPRRAGFRRKRTRDSGTIGCHYTDIAQVNELQVPQDERFWPCGLLPRVPCPGELASGIRRTRTSDTWGCCFAALPQVRSLQAPIHLRMIYMLHWLDVGRCSGALCLCRNCAMDDSIGGSYGVTDLRVQ